MVAAVIYLCVGILAGILKVRVKVVLQNVPCDLGKLHIVKDVYLKCCLRTVLEGGVLCGLDDEKN